MSELPILVSAASLEKSPANVRKTSDPQADARLQANIAERGILQNLVGVPVARKKGHYRITAGGRRLDAIHRLIAAGSFPQDYAVPVLVLKNPKDAVEVSLSENFFRLGMNPAEACRAFRDVIEVERKTPADIAKRFGVTERFVLGRLRLAHLAQPIFDALEADEITLDVAKAYCTTADTARQAAVWQALCESYARDNVSEIRRQLAAYSYRASDPKALLVGRDAYLADGGRVEDADLFSTAADERWIDTHILDALAEARLAAEAEAIREREGLGEVRAVASGRVPYMETCGLKPLSGEPKSLTDEQELRKKEIEAELEQWNAAFEDGNCGACDDDETHIAALEAELAGYLETAPVIDESQKASALAYLVLAEDGTPQIHEQFYAAPVDGGDTGEDEDSIRIDAANNESPDEVENGPARPALSQRLRDMLAMMKTELLAVHVACDPAFALDLGTFIMVDAACRYSSEEIPSELRAPTPARLLGDFRPDTAAATEWTKLDEGLDRSWLDHRPSIIDRYDAFCALPDEARAAWLGWAIARSLRAVPAGDDGSDFIDHLGRKLGIDVAAWWRPTALTYFDRLGKPAILELFEEIGGSELRTRYAGSKKHDLAASAERLFGGHVIMDPQVQARALAWLPEEMRFGPSMDDGDTLIDDRIGDTVVLASPGGDADGECLAEAA
ncbi:ParB/RepB/Spo0J family partition protein [Novosphingobium album (ex Liu et al. 2023)]|uniref:ParB/RepB/Spo0J family partition protein n=1 Tax=Novosphingobium album (ex Liu et al. 2023) TaxID=3031130 RepID=A0ABT5WQK8_9SPHN|nr:ParB/RepB/Spo0J family partition protein [Novosphingobium album (ex Liu et al. 2023)]MDE8652309.1 ParB/RepB/Spo0J family partition protein [Novosphingobium album (ex Liu et al. 2023)]